MMDDEILAADVVLAVDPSGQTEAIWGRDRLAEIARTGVVAPLRVLRVPTTRPEDLAELVAEIKRRRLPN